VFLRVIRCLEVENLDAGLRLIREERAPAWHRMAGYRLSVANRMDAEISLLTCWDTEDDERASYRAIIPIHDQVVEILTPAQAHSEAYQRVIMAGPATRPEAGSWVRTIVMEGLTISTLEATIRSYEDRVLPTFLSAPGMQTCLFGVDRVLGKAVAFSYWSDDASLRTSEAAVATLRQEIAEAYGLQVLDVAVGRLLLTDAPPGAGVATTPERARHEPISPADTRVELEQLGDESIAVVRIRGALDRFSSPRIKNILDRAMEAGVNALVIDPSGVISVDSSGVGILVGTLKRARREGGGLRLAGENAKLATILRMMSLDQMFPTDSSVPDAIMHFRSDTS